MTDLLLFVALQLNFAEDGIPPYGVLIFDSIRSLVRPIMLMSHRECTRSVYDTVILTVRKKIGSCFQFPHFNSRVDPKDMHALFVH